MASSHLAGDIRDMAARQTRRSIWSGTLAGVGLVAFIDETAPASADLRRAAGLLTRMTSYLEKAESLAPSSGSPAPSAGRVPRGDRSS